MALRYVLALGSNAPHHRHGPPARVLDAAVAALEKEGMKVRAVSRWRQSAPLGPSRRRYANGVVLVKSKLDPAALLDRVKRIEAHFGRRTGGQPWSSRVLDIDLVLWSGGAWYSPGLVVPHPAWRDRDFVLEPVAEIAPQWRDPLTGLTARHLLHRLRKAASRP
ncbi:2-amino-4-hydroxy-6-hydroxymethyldihydropteridine diphosphokinase [Novosphingobium kunmingense]|uniref:2-amino-4-hydroxy-6-hydroxymethyldihydropteridine pyrophosphokinase n=1 Tax=Novosphingobium kunmingense TaxID=1211806 RepID=A0A2N0HK85_9SPHN|nr:2-amino-4-hydroxy-6-hydroxymethyldihydropteridine diphosphokinase [Novosphingobium kunmingense]PKB19363.1 2-amino-4-hydroxy-6-hydroxymethyldihydropteridine diphosphokinase [Novosphingobium kunmingense]